MNLNAIIKPAFYYGTQPFEVKQLPVWVVAIFNPSVYSRNAQGSVAP
jgi:hypothetical protein